jgi:hypothetical protein
MVVKVIRWTADRRPKFPPRLGSPVRDNNNHPARAYNVSPEHLKAPSQQPWNNTEGSRDGVVCDSP